MQPRDQARRLLSTQLQEELARIQAARQRLATGRPVKRSQLGELDAHAFGLFLALLGEALAAQTNPDEAVEQASGDGLLRIRLQPLEDGGWAEVHTPAGTFAGRDHLLTITELD